MPVVSVIWLILNPMTRSNLFTLACAFLMLQAPVLHSVAQTDSTQEAYIRQYAIWAVREMQYSSIPASIKMAQALVESNAGQSELALMANNHFGVKCQMVWTGPRYFYDDDEKDDCFRAYQSAQESYRDHSHFLMYRDRYKSLFNLDPRDYKAWSHGLKAAGYATNPNYAQMLINVIERYKLYQLDHWLPEVEPVNSTSGLQVTPSTALPYVKPEVRSFTRNRIEFVIARPDDTVEKLTKELGKLRWEIRRYNDLTTSHELVPGEIVYLQPKKRQAEDGFSTHHVQDGENMRFIAQHYGIKLKWLYKRNRMKPGSEPGPGEIIWLRGWK